MTRRLKTLGYLLGLVIAAVASAEESNPYETPIVLGIPNFQLITGARRIESLKRALPELIGVGLLNEDSVTVRSRSDAWRMVRRVFPKVASEELPGRLYEPEMLDALKINTVFHGRFSEIEGVVRLEGDIENRRTGQMIAVRSVRVPVDDLVVGVGRFVLYIRTALPLLAKRDSDLTLGFRCFEASGVHVEGTDDWLPDDIPLTMSALIRFASGTRLEPWRADIGLCPDDLSTMWSKRPDLILSGKYTINGREITVAVSLHQLDDDDVSEGIEIAKRSGVVDSIVSLSRVLADDVSAAVLALRTVGLGLPKGLGTIRDNSPRANFATGREIFRSTEIRQFDRVTELTLASIHARRSLEDDPGAVRALRLLAEIRLEQKRANDAFDLVKVAIEQHPDDISLLALRARANIAQERFRAAKRDAKVLLGNERTREDGGYLLASIAYLHGEYDAAIDILRGLGASGVELSTKSRKLLAASYRSTGKRAESLDVLTAAKEHQAIGGGVDEQLTEQLIVDVRMAAEEGRNDEALSYLGEAERVGLQDIRISWWRMVILGRQGKFEESLEEYRRVSGYEDSRMLLVLAGSAQRKLGKADAAEQLFSKALELQPDRADALVERASLYFSERREREALRDLDDALKLDRKNVRALVLKAQIEQKRVELDKALVSSTQAVSIAPQFSPALHVKASVLNDLKEFEKAAAIYSILVKAEPDNKVAWNNLAWTMIRARKWESALQASRKALVLDDRYAPALNNGGLALVKTGLPDEGIVWMHRSNEIRPGNSWTLYYLALANLELGSINKAMTFLADAVKININLADEARGAPEFALLKNSPEFKRALGAG